MAIQQLPFPLQYIRQFAGALDRDSVFETTDDRMAYLTNPIRYKGQIVVDCELEQVFILNSALDTWLPVTGENAVSFDDIVEDITGSGNAGELASTAAIVAYVQSMLANAAAYGIKFYAADEAGRLANTPAVEDVNSYLLQEDTRKVYQWTETSTAVYEWVFRFDLDSPVGINNVTGLQSALDTKLESISSNNILLPIVNKSVEVPVSLVPSTNNGHRLRQNLNSNTGAYALNLGFPWVGNESIASGMFSIAMGVRPVANGTAAVSIGNYCLASGHYSFATGQHSEALGPGSYAMGSYVTAQGDYSWASGGSWYNSGARVVVRGRAAFSHQEVTDPNHIGVNGAHSGVLAGVNNSTTDTAYRSLVLACNGWTEILPNMVAVPNLRVLGAIIDSNGNPINLGSGGSGSDGHIIYDNGLAKVQRAKLNFIGAIVTDDPENDATNVEITATGVGVTDGDKGDITVSNGGETWTIDLDANRRFTTDTEKATWNAKASTAVATTTANGLMSSTDRSKVLRQLAPNGDPKIRIITPPKVYKDGNSLKYTAGEITYDGVPWTISAGTLFTSFGNADINVIIYIYYNASLPTNKAGVTYQAYAGYDHTIPEDVSGSFYAPLTYISYTYSTDSAEEKPFHPIRRIKIGTQVITGDANGDIEIPETDGLPDQTGNAGKILSTDGTTASWVSALPDVNIVVINDADLVSGNFTLTAAHHRAHIHFNCTSDFQIICPNNLFKKEYLCKQIGVGKFTFTETGGSVVENFATKYTSAGPKAAVTIYSDASGVWTPNGDLI